MKTMVIPATEVSQFWNILKRFAKRKKWTVMFKNHNAIFTATTYSGGMLSYSAKYEGPDDDRTFTLWPTIMKHKTSNAAFTLDVDNLLGSLRHTWSAENCSAAANLGEKQEFDDIQDEGAETPADMPKILNRLIKIRRGTRERKYDGLYFEGGIGWKDSFAISTNGIGMFHTKIPLLSESNFSIPIFPMKCLPGNGLVSFYEKNGERMLCYQVGGWLYTTEKGASCFNSLEERNHRLSNPYPAFPAIKIDESDFKAIMVFTTTWRDWEWKRKVPVITFRTDPQGKIYAEFAYCRIWHGDKPALAPMLLNKTKWINGSVDKFSVRLMELRNAMSAGFSEFSVELRDFITFIKSESKGMWFVAKCVT